MLLFLPFASGCVLGPTALRKTHGRYHEAVKQVQDEGLLRNLVRLRYTEALSTLDVASITAQVRGRCKRQRPPFLGRPEPGRQCVQDLSASLARRGVERRRPADHFAPAGR